MRKSYAQFFSVIKLRYFCILFCLFPFSFIFPPIQKLLVKQNKSGFNRVSLFHHWRTEVGLIQQPKLCYGTFCRHRRYAYWNKCITDTEMLKQHKTEKQYPNFFIFIYAFTRWGRGVWKLWLRRQRYLPSIFCLPQLFRMSDSHHNYEKST